MTVGIEATPMEHLAEDPANPVEGQLWYNTTDMTLRRFVNGEVQEISFRGSHDEDSEQGRVCESEDHYHRDGYGFLHRCYHKCRPLFTWQFFAGITLSFPLEHALWTKVWPFYHIAELLGLGVGHH